MRRVLIVSPRFPPTNAADMHRVRQSLPYFAEGGWEAVVLAVDPMLCDQPVDPILLETVPSSVRIVRTKAIDVSVTRRLGFGSLDIRAYFSLRRAGAKLLLSERFDLVYFSTTAFMLMTLGPIWRRRFGVPFVIDLQDPWFSDYYERPGAPDPPGGRLKYNAMRSVAWLQERATMRAVSHVISVSEAYPATLVQRYNWMTPDQFTVLPFGAAQIDLEILSQADVRQSIYDPKDGHEHWVYVGRAGGDMEFALAAFFKALAEARISAPAKYENLRLYFVGTTYAIGRRAKPTVSPIAERYGVGDLVEEHPHRIPYFEGLRCLMDADALIVPGSDDPGYTASKLYPYILARRPLLAVFHERSSVVEILRKTRAGTIVQFASDATVEGVSAEILEHWFNRHAPTPNDTDWHAFSAYSARTMALHQCTVFDRAVDYSRSPK